MTVALVVTLIAVLLVTIVPRVVPLKCDEVDFCKTLRNRSPINTYLVDPYTIEIDDIGIVRFQLVTIAEGDNLQVEIFAYKDDIIRIKVKDLDSTRYELSDIFAGAPSLAGVQSVYTEALRMIITTNIGSQIEIQFAPFNVLFYREGVLGLTLDGKRIFVDNSDNSHWLSAGIAYNQASHLYGLAEHATGLNLRYTDSEDPYRLYNKDNPNYPINETASVYGVVPLVYGHSSIITTGVFLHNAAQQFVDILPNGGNPMAYFMAEAGTLDLFVFLGPTPFQVLRQYLLITGTPHMPPLWALGYHQCRFSYLSQDDVKDVIANFDSHNFQMDAIWLDLDHTDGKRYFTWNPTNYSDPVGLQESVAATNRKMVVIVDPHVKVDNDYIIYEEGYERDLFVKNPDGTNFEADCWPGISTYWDFLNYEATSYYANRISYENYPNSTSVIAGIWNDMNEPTVFNVPEGTLGADIVHYRGVKHKELHNAYGMLQVRATWQGLLARDNRTTRPFVLSRSFFAGSQRYTAVWTGDIRSTFEYLAISIPMCLNANILGVAFCGADVAGFNDFPSAELFQRWYQLGAWFPFYRAHSDQSTERREPYLWPDDVQAVVRKAIQVRYRHLPVWYTLFHEHIAYKVPIMRPVFFHYTYDNNTYTLEKEFLVGQNILVYAVAEEGAAQVSVYFPGGVNEIWYSMNDFSTQTGIGEVSISVDINFIPVYYRGGSIIVTKDTIRATTVEMANDSYTLYVNLDLNKEAHGTVYLDDTTSLLYLDWVEYNFLTIYYAPDGTLTFTKIDEHSNSSLFPFVVGEVIINEYRDSALTGEYTQKSYKMDVDGTLLENYKINFKNESKLQLKLY